MKALVLVFAFLLAASVSGYWHRSRNTDPLTPEWDKLSVTWMRWDELPLTVSEAVEKGWSLQDRCGDAVYFHGNRFLLNGDRSFALLFDANDKIAGIQTAIPKLDIKPKGLPWIQEKDHYVITAYFKDPRFICSRILSRAKYIGDRVLIQNSSLPKEFVQTPLLEEGIKESDWTEGECFWSMGRLYWYNLLNVDDCNSLFPLFLMYTNGLLNGFGWVLPYKVNNTRFVYPTNTSYPYLFKPGTAPSCLLGAENLSLLHIYLDSYPFLNIC